MEPFPIAFDRGFSHSPSTGAVPVVSYSHQHIFAGVDMDGRNNIFNPLMCTDYPPWLVLSTYLLGVA